MQTINYSFVIPVYKSVNSLEPLYKGIQEIMIELEKTFEVIFIEDNGSEESWRKLLELKKADNDNITLIKLTKNFGQNGATLCGIEESKGEIIITTDDDLQIHPSELKKLISCHNETGAAVIYGVYKDENQNRFRNLSSYVLKKIFNKSEGGSNIGSSIRLFNADMGKHLKKHLQDHLFINQVLSWYTFDTKFIDIKRNPRFEGKSGYNYFQLLSIGFRLLFLYTSIPLKIMIVVCVFAAIGSLGFAAYYLHRHYTLGQGLGFLSFIVIAISLILASISVMGIYLNRIYTSRVKKPHYAIKIKL